jgi:plasmid stabilization system protein ParE
MPAAFVAIISSEAAADISALHAYIAQDSPDNAKRMVNRILASIENLTTFPHRTVFQRRSRKIKYPVRTLTVRPYVIYFRVQDDDRIVRVLTIRHGARRRPRRFD